jgi:hypothetical protein
MARQREEYLIEQRLLELREELVHGQQQMAALDQRRQELRDTMLRISGAIQVLEELMAKNGHGEPQHDPPESTL